MIIHFTRAGRPVLVEILDACEFLAKELEAWEEKRNQLKGI